ncbi:hypothetical protein EB796_020336 [Bugula neritina]|uniref:Uncharacterized protein n=1 Tax=Bugula neritina TaxID=10212 RepID=A0A7J7J584_BUGNE|nr:hypothetical protein EB796_020336 [Bugula neritina]
MKGLYQVMMFVFCTNWVVVRSTPIGSVPDSRVLSHQIISRVRTEQVEREESALSDLLSLNAGDSAPDQPSGEDLTEIIYLPAPTTTRRPTTTGYPTCLRVCYLCLAAGEHEERDAYDCVDRCIQPDAEKLTCPSHPFTNGSI